MSEDKIELTQGSGNVFADLGYVNADIHQAKAILAAEIIKALDAAGLSVRKAEARTGTAAADFTRIRNGDLSRFTIDRLMRVLGKLDHQANVQLTVSHVQIPTAPLLQLG